MGTKLGLEIMARRPGEDYVDIEPFMDHTEAYHVLSNAHYPLAVCKETNSVLKWVLNIEMQELNCPPAEAAEELDEADQDQIMADDIFRFLEKAYYDAAHCIDDKYWFSLGRLYYYDRYGHVDLEKAVFYLKKAVEHLDGRAEVLLGKCYLNGEGVEQDYEKAFYLLLKGALLDYSGEAVYLLGDFYLNGWYVEQDKPQAYQMYLRAHKLLDREDDELDADVLCRIGDYKLNEIGEHEAVFNALSYYQRAERLYYVQKKHHVRGAEQGLVRSRQGQIAVRERLAELEEKAENLFYTED